MDTAPDNTDKAPLLILNATPFLNARETAALTARQTGGSVPGANKAAPALSAKEQRAFELEAARAELTEAKARTERLTAELEADNRRRAESAVERAIQHGAVPARAFALQTKWREKIAGDNELVELLDAVLGSPALRGALPQVEPVGDGATQ